MKILFLKKYWKLRGKKDIFIIVTETNSCTVSSSSYLQLRSKYSHPTVWGGTPVKKYYYHDFIFLILTLKEGKPFQKKIFNSTNSFLKQMLRVIKRNGFPLVCHSKHRLHIILWGRPCSARARTLILETYCEIYMLLNHWYALPVR